MRLGEEDKDDDFGFFADNLRRAFALRGIREKRDPAEVLAEQRRQFEALTGLEVRFRERLRSDARGASVFEAFVSKIRDENRDILSCRPFFRERQDVCSGPITEALKARDADALTYFHFNSNFVRFAMTRVEWPRRHPLRVIAKRIELLRDELVVANAPLAIGQAMAFWRKAPVRTGDWRSVPMDYVQIAVEGLATAIDKFVMPPSAVIDADPKRFRVWRAVAIGRMRGNFIKHFSATSVHFFPDDKRKIYRANKHVFRYRGPQIREVDFEGLARMVNGDLAEAGIKTTAAELRELMSAAVHASEGKVGPDGCTVLDAAQADESWRPDYRVEWSEVVGQLAAVGGELDEADRKLLRMHGVDVDSMFVEG